MINVSNLFSIGLYTASFGILLYMLRTGAIVFGRPQSMPKMKPYEFYIFILGFVINIVSYFV